MCNGRGLDFVLWFLFSVLPTLGCVNVSLLAVVTGFLLLKCQKSELFAQKLRY